ncbi:MAG: pseudaminic acid cytidylyltransferase [Spirulina sp. SIO3F2]|nr:pseudaminic acid cytidylyltransferase [Spirulina sp. SIO3F2]
MKIAVIPARGGSKRIPRKNIRSFAGKPAIAHVIQVALDSGLFDNVWVSTDDLEIAEVAQQWGATIPFLRPPELADDFVGITPVIAHATNWARSQNLALDAVCCIYATAMLCQSQDLVKGWQTLNTGDWLYSFSATEFAAPIFRAFQQTESGGVEMFFPEHFTTRSQDLPMALHDAGQFCWGRPHAWQAQKQIFAPWSIPTLIPRWRVQDIDTEIDWQQAEKIWRLLQTQS